MTKADSAHTTTSSRRRRTPKPRPRIDIESLPEIYALICSGKSMEPEIADGTPLVIDRAAPVRPGDLVIIYLRPEFMVPGANQSIVKRLVMTAAPSVEYPYNPHPDSTALPVIVVEQRNPERRWTERCDRIAAIHRCLGSATLVDGQVVVPPGFIEDARRG